MSESHTPNTPHSLSRHLYYYLLKKPLFCLPQRPENPRVERSLFQCGYSLEHFRKAILKIDWSYYGSFDISSAGSLLCPYRNQLLKSLGCYVDHSCKSEIPYDIGCMRDTKEGFCSLEQLLCCYMTGAFLDSILFLGIYNCLNHRSTLFVFSIKSEACRPNTAYNPASPPPAAISGSRLRSNTGSRRGDTWLRSSLCKL